MYTTWMKLDFYTIKNIRKKRKVRKGVQQPQRTNYGSAMCKCKLMPLVINKYENPRTLEHYKSNLPVTLKSQKNAWMTQTLFCDWFQNYFKCTGTPTKL